MLGVLVALLLISSLGLAVRAEKLNTDQASLLAILAFTIAAFAGEATPVENEDTGSPAPSEERSSGEPRCASSARVPR